MLIANAIQKQDPVVLQPNDGNTLMPVFLKLNQLRVLLIGAGPVGLEKLLAIVKNSPHANITVLADDVNDEIVMMANSNPNITIIQKHYEAEDLLGAQVVFVAVNNLLLSEKIVQDAHALDLLVNVADTPDQCDFYLGSVVKKGDLKIAISTNGKSPTIAKRLRETFEEALPSDMHDLLQNMHVLRQQLRGDFASKVAQLNRVTASLSTISERRSRLHWLKIARWSLLVFAIMLLGHWVFSYLPLDKMASDGVQLINGLDSNFKWVVLAGFLAQVIDGSLGMGYGITSATILISAGVHPAAISGSIHTAEMFASGASGYSHYKFGNVNKKLFKAIVIPGVIGSILGAVLLVQLGEKDAQFVRPVMAAYTMFLGIKFIINAFKQNIPAKKFRHYKSLAGIGGFLDSFGGGGWGPIVTSTLLNRGKSPRYVIGTVSLTEFFVTLSSAFSFFILIGVSHWQIIIALIVGSFIGAPLGAKFAGRMPRKTAFLLLGVLVIVWSCRILWRMLA